MKTKLFSLIVLLAFLPARMTAAGLVNTLHVLTKDKAVHQFLLTDKPQVKFEGTKLLITSEKATVSFALSDVIRFTYKATDPTGIEELEADGEPAVSYSNDGTVTISQLPANATATVYTMDGRTVQQLKARHAGTYRLSLSGLPSGVYLVKAGSTTYKITKR